MQIGPVPWREKLTPDVGQIRGGWGDFFRTVQSLLAGLRLYSGTGSPENVVSAPVGSLYQRTDGGAGTTLYVKESGTGNTGWIGK